jgi:hypothetical protein
MAYAQEPTTGTYPEPYISSLFYKSLLILSSNLHLTVRSDRLPSRIEDIFCEFFVSQYEKKAVLRPRDCGQAVFLYDALMVAAEATETL